LQFVNICLASVVSRFGSIFLYLSFNLGSFGPTYKGFIDKYFNLLVILFTIALIGGFVVVKIIPGNCAEKVFQPTRNQVSRPTGSLKGRQNLSQQS
jgi:hypothetical protein